jgi:hypothetical protein
VRRCRYNCFLTGRKREQPAWPERLKPKSLPGSAAVLAEGARQSFGHLIKIRFSVPEAPEEKGVWGFDGLRAEAVRGLTESAVRSA